MSDQSIPYLYYFDDNITTESVNGLVERLQDIEGKIELYFSTNGGLSTAMNFLIRFLNSRKDDITVVLTDRCYSAGVDILVLFEGKIRFEELDCILFHVLDREKFSYRVGEYAYNPKILAKQDKEFNLMFAEKIKKKGLLTENQIKDFLKGHDVVVYKDKFNKWKL